MRADRTGLWWLLLVGMAAAPACAPGGKGGEGEAAQAAEGAEDGSAEDGADPGDKPAPEGGCGSEPEAACTGVAAGDGTSCLDDAALLSAAQGACAALGSIAVEILPSFDCDGAGSTMAKVLCCVDGEPGEVPAEPPAPGNPPPDGALGDGTTCVANSDFLQMAQAACDELGLTLIDLFTSDDCPGEASHWAKYICGP